MRVLDKYITGKILISYVFILLIFIGVYYLADIFSFLADILRSKLSLHTLWIYYSNMLPLIFVRMSPFSLLISSLFVFGELNKNNEITSMRASGISMPRIVLPAIFCALIISAAAMFVQEKILINSQIEVEKIKAQFDLKNAKNEPDEEKNVFFTSDNIVFYARTLRPKDNSMEDLIIFGGNEAKTVTTKTYCKKAFYQNGTWTGKEIIAYQLDAYDNIKGLPTMLEEKDLKLKETPKELLTKKKIFSQSVSIKTLRKEINRLQKAGGGKNLNSLLIDQYNKIAQPFSHIFLIISILPLALRIRKRQASLSSLGTGFFCGFLYYLLMSITMAMGKAALLSPGMSIWLIPTLFVSIGLIGLARIK
jgi:lipopolysaccharide export system permease protein